MNVQISVEFNSVFRKKCDESQIKNVRTSLLPSVLNNMAAVIDTSLICNDRSIIRNEIKLATGSWWGMV
jgi:hypothetical protein